MNAFLTRIPYHALGRQRCCSLPETVGFPTELTPPELAAQPSPTLPSSGTELQQPLTTNLSRREAPRQLEPLILFEVEDEHRGGGSRNALTRFRLWHSGPC